MIARHNHLTARRLSAAFLCILAVGLFLYDWRRLNPRDPALIRLANEKRIIFGINPDFPPFGMIENDQVIGLDADIARELARRMGAVATFRVLGFDGLYDALKVGEADALISALAFDPARLGDFRFSLPYFEGGSTIVSRAGYTTIRDLDGKRVAVEMGTPGDDAARLWARRLRRLNKVDRPTSAEALEAVLLGEADAALVDPLAAVRFLRDQPGFQQSAEPVEPLPYLIVTRTRSAELLKRINAALAGMLADGTLAEIRTRWVMPR